MGDVVKSIELRRHTDSDGDVLSREGVEAALEVGASLDGNYEAMVSSGAQRATQTLACFLTVLGEPVPRGVIVDPRFRSKHEDRWKRAYKTGGGGDIASFLTADPDLVREEAALLAGALGELFEGLRSSERALVVGHSPMQEVAVYGLTGKVVEPLAKGGGIEVTEDDEGDYTVRELG
ncbi:MAG TPA: histidine phosphatase family protein [Actinomycetota bacterium]|nr:histidine phosphatase family protein [Actinomycetota bacterium]